MSTIGFFSAKGAPGVTTAAMLVASLWPRPALLADCDPAGGDVGLRLPGPDGRPLDLASGLLSLLPLARRGLAGQAVLEHAQPVLGGGEVIVGITGPEQAAAVGPVWPAVAQAFAGLDELAGRDVIVDLGRLDPTSPVLPLAASAQVLACVLDASVSSVFSARSRLRTLLPALDGTGTATGPKLGLIVRSKHERDARGAYGVLKSEFPDLLELGWLALDPLGARIFDGERVSRPERTVLVRSGGGLIVALESALYLTQWSAGSAPDAPVGGAHPDNGGPARPSRSAERARRRADSAIGGRFVRGREPGPRP